MPFEPSPVTNAERAELRGGAGACADCSHLQLVSSKRSRFVRCGLSDLDDRFPRYPPLPVRLCPGFLAIPPPGEVLSDPPRSPTS